MLIIDSPAAMRRALDQPLAPALRRLLILRSNQLDGDADAARFTIVGSEDRLADVEAAIGFPLVLHEDDGTEAPSFDWADRHDGGLVEIGLFLSDGGAAEIVLLFDRDDTDPALIDLLHRHVSPGDQR